MAQDTLRDLDARRQDFRKDPKKVGELVDKHMLPHFDTRYAAQLVTAGFTPRQPFERGGKGWGGLLLPVRYGELDVDSGAFPIFADPTRAVARIANAGVSLGWSLNRVLKIVLDYQNTTFDGGAPAGGDRETEPAVLTRLQVNF